MPAHGPSLRRSGTSSQLRSHRRNSRKVLRGCPTTSWPPAPGQGSGTLRRRVRHVAACGIPAGCGLDRPGARCNTRRPCGAEIASPAGIPTRATSSLGYRDAGPVVMSPAPITTSPRRSSSSDGPAGEAPSDTVRLRVRSHTSGECASRPHAPAPVVQGGRAANAIVVAALPGAVVCGRACLDVGFRVD